MEQRPKTNARKYLFDNNDFGEEALRKKLEAARRPTFSEDQLEAARQEGFLRGKNTGIKETLESQEAQIRDVLQQVVFAADRLEQAENQRLATFIDNAALVAVQGLVRTCPAMLEVFALEQIDAFIRNVLAEQIKSQTILIYVAPAHAEQIAKRLEDMLAGLRRKLSCTVQADPMLDGLQCRFEWTGGGAEWDPRKTTEKMLETLVSHLPPSLQGQSSAGVDAEALTPHNGNDHTGDAS